MNKKLLLLCLMPLILLSQANAQMFGTHYVPPYHNNSTQIYDLDGVSVKGSGSSPQDNPYQCSNSGDITSITCKGFGALNDDLIEISGILSNILNIQIKNYQTNQDIDKQLSDLNVKIGTMCKC